MGEAFYNLSVRRVTANSPTGMPRSDEAHGLDAPHKSMAWRLHFPGEEIGSEKCTQVTPGPRSMTCPGSLSLQALSAAPRPLQGGRSQKEAKMLDGTCEGSA